MPGHKHVGEYVLDRLEGADRHAELLALLDVVAAEPNRSLDCTDGLRHQCDRSAIDRFA